MSSRDYDIIGQAMAGAFDGQPTGNLQPHTLEEAYQYLREHLQAGAVAMTYQGHVRWVWQCDRPERKSQYHCSRPYREAGKPCNECSEPPRATPALNQARGNGPDS